MLHDLGLRIRIAPRLGQVVIDDVLADWDDRVAARQAALLERNIYIFVYLAAATRR